MMDDDDPVSVIEFLARSRTRVEILTTLAAEDSLSKDELRARFDASRTTIQRNLEALAEQGWVTCSNREYAITGAGRWIAADFAELAETVEEAARFRPVFEAIDADALGFDLRDHDVTVTTATSGDPLRPIGVHIENVTAATELRALVPMMDVRAVEAAHERAVADGMRMSFVLTEAAAEALRTNARYAEHYEGMRRAPTVDIRVTDEALPFYLGLYADSVELGVGDDWRPTALLETDSAPVYRWAEGRFAAHREDAVPIEAIEASR